MHYLVERTLSVLEAQFGFPNHRAAIVVSMTFEVQPQHFVACKQLVVMAVEFKS